MGGEARGNPNPDVSALPTEVSIIAFVEIFACHERQQLDGKRRIRHATRRTSTKSKRYCRPGIHLWAASIRITCVNCDV